MIDLARVPELLTEHLPDHLVRQRWSGAHDRTVSDLTLRWHEVLLEGDPLLVWAVVDVRFDDGTEQAYQVFVGGRAADPLPEFLHGKERELVATVGDGIDIVLYDALVDPDLPIEVLHLVAPDVEVEVRRPIVLEHSNSSIVFDEALILKVFRKIEPGPNPDVEITHVLASRGSPHVLAPLAELRRDDTDLAVLRAFIVGATEGWVLARTSVRDVLAARVAPEEAGGDFAPDAERLGAVLGELHVAMADAWGRAPGDVEGWVAHMEAQVHELLVTAPDAPLDTAAVLDRYRECARVADAGAEIRIHGDLHLAQVIRVDAGWLVLDFEGEPARRRDDRFTTSSPLRDVAGMLRSMHYVAAIGLADWGEPDREPDPELGRLADQWERRNRDAFLAGYLAVPGVDELLPADEADRARVLAAFELDKAVYEIAYELGHRPDHVTIPLTGVERLIRTAAAS